MARASQASPVALDVPAGSSVPERRPDVVERPQQRAGEAISSGELGRADEQCAPFPRSGEAQGRAFGDEQFADRPDVVEALGDNEGLIGHARGLVPSP